MATSLPGTLWYMYYMCMYMYMHIYNLCVHVLYVHVHVGENKIGGLFQSTHFGAVLTAVQSILHLA